MIAKTKKDRERLTLSDGFKSILYADLKDTNNASAAQMIQHPITQTAQSGGSLAQVQPFPVDSRDWAPPPYQPANPASTAAVGQKDSELAKASLIFTLNRDDKLSAVAETESQAAPTVNLGIGNRLSARLASVVTTAVQIETARHRGFRFAQKPLVGCNSN